MVPVDGAFADCGSSHQVQFLSSIRTKAPSPRGLSVFAASLGSAVVSIHAASVRASRQVRSVSDPGDCVTSGPRVGTDEALGVDSFGLFGARRGPCGWMFSRGHRRSGHLRICWMICVPAGKGFARGQCPLLEFQRPIEVSKASMICATTPLRAASTDPL